MIRLNSHQLRQSDEFMAKNDRRQLKRNPIVLVLDNVLDTYNIGTFFRLADAIAAQKIYLCGPIVTPPNIKIHRSSIGTWKWVEWEHYSQAEECLQKLKEQGYYIVACEQNSKSRLYYQIKYQFPLALVIGSENFGVGESSLKFCDQIAEIPMHGINKSLNVLVAASVIAYHAVQQKYKTDP